MKSYNDLKPFARTAAEHTVLDALAVHGTQPAAAASLGWSRPRLQSRLRAIQARAAAEAPPCDGAVRARTSVPPPPGGGRGRVRRYILTAAQNNTPVHGAFLDNLEAFAEHIGAQILVATFTYNKAAYGKNNTKRGTSKSSDTDDLWYDPRLADYLWDQRTQLAPDLLWCAEMNILPTAVRPLSGLDTYGAGSSCIFPHAKIALEGLPVMGAREPRINMTTGAVTLRNYIAKKDGLKGDFHHGYSGTLVEVDTRTGHWWARHLNADSSGAFYDLTTHVAGCRVLEGVRPEAVSWGDIHASEIDPGVAARNWDQAGFLDVLRPRYQLWHDTFSMRSRSHHEAKSFERRYTKWVQGGDHESVRAEIDTTRALLCRAARTWCTTVVVNSNHDRHLERWLDEADFRADLPNAEFFLEAQLSRVRAIQRGESWDGLRWALQDAPNCRFLRRDESFILCPDNPIECGQHGDEGPNGSRGGAGFGRVASRMVVGHAHTPSIRDGVTTSGVCQRRMGYAHGPSSWAVAHTIVYPNGKRALLFERDGKLWA